MALFVLQKVQVKSWSNTGSFLLFWLTGRNSLIKFWPNWDNCHHKLFIVSWSATVYATNAFQRYDVLGLICKHMVHLMLDSHFQYQYIFQYWWKYFNFIINSVGFIPAVLMRFSGPCTVPNACHFLAGNWLILRDNGASAFVTPHPVPVKLSAV